MNVRDGRAESVKQADAAASGCACMVDGKTALVYTSDFRPEAMQRAGRARGRAGASNSEPDPANAVRRRRTVLRPRSSSCYDPAVAALTPDAVIARAIEAEKVARAVDPRVKSDAVRRRRPRRRRDLDREHPRRRVELPATPRCSVFIGVLADDEDGKQRIGKRGQLSSAISPI